MPEGTAADPIYHRDALFKKIRCGDIDDAEFGLALRLQGYADIAYDPDSVLLDNKKVFDAIRNDVNSGIVSGKEHEIVNRYFFQGINSIPTKLGWESLLHKSGFDFTCQQFTGKNWYAWYPIYNCKVNAHNS